MTNHSNVMESNQWVSRNAYSFDKASHCLPYNSKEQSHRGDFPVYSSSHVPCQGSESDEFSDHDSHYSEDLNGILDEEFETPVETHNLLEFVKKVNSDIHKFFSTKPEKDDSCDIFEDKWTSTKSGREMYYDELLKIAKGEPLVSQPTCAWKSGSTTSKSKCENSGKMDQKKGLGPFGELFEFGLYSFYGDQELNKSAKRLIQKRRNTLRPMSGRYLPASFWREPRSEYHAAVSEESKPVHANVTNISQTAFPPDFSDLLQSWTGDPLGLTSHSGDCSSEISMISSESSVEHVL